MKQIIALIGVTCVLIVGATITFPEESWLFVYGNRAAEYSEKMLSGETPPTPEWAINVVVNKAEGIVTFGNHGSSKIFAFSPKGIPQLHGLKWKNKWGNWYVSQIKT